MINQLLQVKAFRTANGLTSPTLPADSCVEEQSIQLRMLTERLYALLDETHEKGLGYLLPVAFRSLHVAKMAGEKPALKDMLDELQGQELFDFEHATLIVFDDEPEPDIDEPGEEDEEDSLSLADCPF